MLLKYKLLIILLVLAASAAVLVLPGTGFHMDTGDDESLVEEVTLSVHDDPYRYFLEARQAELPIVLEFYARW